MRFGHFLHPTTFDTSRDDQAIEVCLDEAELVKPLNTPTPCCAMFPAMVSGA